MTSLKNTVLERLKLGVRVEAQGIFTGPRKGKVAYWKLYLGGRPVRHGGRGKIWREAMKEAGWDA